MPILDCKERFSLPSIKNIRAPILSQTKGQSSAPFCFQQQPVAEARED